MPVFRALAAPPFGLWRSVTCGPLLPSEVARDPERLGRFRREAQLLASLNHSSIAAI